MWVEEKGIDSWRRWLGCGVIVVVIVAWLALWSFGNDVGVVWWWLVTVAIVVVVMVAWLALWLFGSEVGCCNGGWYMVGPKITIEKEKPTSKGHSPVNTKNSL